MPIFFPSVTLDGSAKKEGGLLLRTALSVTALTQQGLCIKNIRGTERKPGLSVEDLTIIDALAKICRAKVEGAEFASSELQFIPQSCPRAIDQTFSIYEYMDGPVTGSTSKILEVIVPILSRSGSYSQIAVLGETYPSGADSYDRFEHATLNLYKRFGLYAHSHLIASGFGHRTRGKIQVDIEPSGFQPLEWEVRGALRHIKATMSVSNLKKTEVLQYEKLIRELFSNFSIVPEIEIVEIPSLNAGLSLILLAEFENGLGGTSMISHKKELPKNLVQKAFDEFENWYLSDATVDANLALQFLILAAFAPGKSSMVVPSLSDPLQTMAWVIKQFLPIKMTLTQEQNGRGKVVVSSEEG